MPQMSDAEMRRADQLKRGGWAALFVVTHELWSEGLRFSLDALPAGSPSLGKLRPRILQSNPFP